MLNVSDLGSPILLMLCKHFKLTCGFFCLDRLLMWCFRLSFCLANESQLDIFKTLWLSRKLYKAVIYQADPNTDLLIFFISIKTIIANLIIKFCFSLVAFFSFDGHSGTFCSFYHNFSAWRLCPSFIPISVYHQVCC